MYKAEVVEPNIVITSGTTVKKTIPIATLYLNDGTHPRTLQEFEIDQQKINYLDSIKDGTNVPTMQQLNIYPLAGPPYPNFPESLNDAKKKIDEMRASYLETTTWLKVKKGSVLDPPKKYNKCLWESGLGYDVFLDEPKNVITVKTFGSYIDPLEKQNAKIVWPPNGETVILHDSFMKLMGFGENSSVTAKTKSNTTFAYTMNVGCGQGCTPTTCTIQHDGNKDDPNLKYFAGNQEKKKFLTTSAGAEEKSKTIVVKEWGDKTQVLIYFIYFYILGATTIVMITCDSVVFMLCLNLGLPCIYSGTGLVNGKKSYSIVEYKPSDTPFTDVRTRLFAKIDSIQAENKSFIDSLEKLATDDGANTQISDNNKLMTFTKDFYLTILKDLNAIQVKLIEERVKFVNKYPMLPEDAFTKDIEKANASNISAIENDIKSVRRFIIIPFLKKKSTGLTILMTKSYTLEKPIQNIKPNIQTYLQDVKDMDAVIAARNSKKSFYEIARKYFLVPEERKGDQRGGAGLTPEQISSFPEDDDSVYTYVTNDENENENKIYSQEQQDSPIFNPEITPDVKNRNLLTELKSSFNQTVAIAKLSEQLKDTVYTLFVYESYINGTGKCIFDQDDLTRIIQEYELEIPPVHSTISASSLLPVPPPVDLNLSSLKTPILERFHQRKVTVPRAFSMREGVKSLGNPDLVPMDDESIYVPPPPRPPPPPPPPPGKRQLINVIEQDEQYEQYEPNKIQKMGNSLSKKDPWINLFVFGGFKKTVRKRKVRKTIKKRMNPKNKRTYKRR